MALHLKATPICCFKGTKSSLVIEQKVEIGYFEPFYTKHRGQFGGIIFLFEKGMS